MGGDGRVSPGDLKLGGPTSFNLKVLLFSIMTETWAAAGAFDDWYEHSRGKGKQSIARR